VLAVVEACTDADAEEKADEREQDEAERYRRWKDRKERYIEHLEHAPGSVLIVSASDKVHNARAIVRDIELTGREVFDRFGPDRKDTLWYYGALADVFERRVADEPRIQWLAGELLRKVEGMQRG